MMRNRSKGLKMQDDVTGDGLLLQMRVKDAERPLENSPGTPAPHGSPRCDRSSIRNGRDVLPPVPGRHFREITTVVTLTVQRNKEGLDLNRNFPAHWRNEAEQFGAGPFPGSEPEVYNLVKVYHFPPEYHRRHDLPYV